MSPSESPAESPAAGGPGVFDRLRAVPVIRLGGMAIAALGMRETVDLMIEAAQASPRPGRPLYMTSANGEVLSRHARSPDFARLFVTADLVNADGQPMVLLSRWLGARALPERVATTDLFHGVAREAAARGLSFYLFGASEDENRRAVENVQALYPSLRIVGRSHGYLTGEALSDTLDQIDALAPDILWLALGVPREQAFVHEHSARLAHVGIIKTSGGLFNFLSGSRTRAPAWMQRAGLEWAWRLRQEPIRLFWRYAVTNPHAIGLMLAHGRGGALTRGMGRLVRALLPSRTPLVRR